jgi:hypothetical protein
MALPGHVTSFASWRQRLPLGVRSIELNGDELRRDPLAVRKATLASLVARATPGLRLNEHLDDDDGPLVFEHACKLGLEGIVSKRRNCPYRSGRSSDWIKSKNPAAPAVSREAEEDWGGDLGSFQSMPPDRSPRPTWHPSARAGFLRA